MKSIPILLLFVSVLLQPRASAAEPAASGIKIVIKVDDLKVGGSKVVSKQWQRLANFIVERKLKCGIGIIANSLEGDKPQYFQWIKDLHSSGLVEFWLHAYDHVSWNGSDGVAHNEFAARSYEEQLQRFQQCQQLAFDKLGFYFQTFGPPGTNAPGPAYDENTFKASAAESHIKVWLYGSPIDDAGRQLEADGKTIVLDRVWKMNIEQPLFKPNSAAVEAGYAQYAAKREYFVLQGHPQHWDDEGFAEFVKIIDFLTAQGATFVTPTECAALVSGNAEPAPAKP